MGWYPRASEALSRLERLLNTPQKERMPCMVMYGPSHIGKTLIIAKFLRAHPPGFDRQRGVGQRPVISMQMALVALIGFWSALAPNTALMAAVAEHQIRQRRCAALAHEVESLDVGAHSEPLDDMPGEPRAKVSRARTHHHGIDL
jgi:hypothetical protein